MGKPSRPTDPRGKPTTGRIVTIMSGQGHGYIRLRDKRQVYFHRADVLDDTRFSDLEIGETVSFELLEDPISGARALRVTRARKK
jgi:cold shock CspA family protein